MAKREDTYSYRGWLVSDFLFKRALAVFGHYFLISLVGFFINHNWTHNWSLKFALGK